MGNEDPNCRNRDVVNVKNRLYSPAYDWDREAGRPWWNEPTDGHSMCFLGMCDYFSYNAWLEATDNYYNDVFLPQYDEVVSRAQGFFGGAAFPQNLADRLNGIADIINAWESFDKTEKTLKDNFFHVLPTYWAGQVRTIVNHFDEAACAVDDLNEIATVDLKSKYLVKGAPKRSIEPVEGGFLGNPAGTESAGSKGMSGVGMAVGLVAIGAAGYFGFKVLTE